MPVTDMARVEDAPIGVRQPDASVILKHLACPGCSRLYQAKDRGMDVVMFLKRQIEDHRQASDIGKSPRVCGACKTSLSYGELAMFASETVVADDWTMKQTFRYCGNCLVVACIEATVFPSDGG